MTKRPDDRITSWKDDAPDGSSGSPRVFNAVLLDERRAPYKAERLLSRTGFLAGLASVLSVVGLNRCAFFLKSENDRVRRNRYQYCTCVPVCVCDLVCTCNLVSGQATNIKKTEDKYTTEQGAGVCKCVPVCTCDLVCTCDSQCTCQSQGGGGGGGRTVCTCNPYWYPN